MSTETDMLEDTSRYHITHITHKKNGGTPMTALQKSRMDSR
jgi:hypothetical protein